MDKRSPRWRLACAIAIAALLAIISAGLLFAAERARTALPEASPEEVPEPKAPREAPSPPAAPETPTAFGGVQIVAPESGAKLRGLAVVKAEWPNPAGYAIFRVDDRFAYATTLPYEMRWDTSGAADGQHIVTIDIYDSSGRYAGTSSIGVVVENAVPTPPEGVLLTVRFDEHDLLTRTIAGRGELSALRSDEALPEGFDALGGELRADLNQAVMDAFYEGTSALVRTRLRTGSLIVEGNARALPEVGQYAMVQISRNGLTIPATAATTKPRLGLGEVSLALRDYPVVPGDTWESPVGVVCELYTRRAVFVQARHTFEGLRWYRGRECAVVTSSYTVPQLPLLAQASEQAAATSIALPRHDSLELTGARGRRGGRGGREMRGGRGAGRMGDRAARGPSEQAGRRAAPGRRAAAGQLENARLVDLEGTRRTYITRQTGRVLRSEDTILGKLEFRVAAGAQRASAEGMTALSADLTAGRAGRGMGRGAERRGGRAARMAGERQAGAAGRAPRAAAGQRPGAGAAGANIPPRLNYGFRLTSDFVIP